MSRSIYRRVLIAVVTIASAGPVGSVTAFDGTIVVAQDGGGDFTTITEAVAAAEADDTVLIGPGIYIEAVTIDEDITLQGDGPREDIVVVAPEQAPMPVSGHVGDEHETFALFLDGSDATVSDVTVRGESSVVIVRGGAPTLSGLLVDGVGTPGTSPDEGSDGSSVVVDGGSTAIIRENDLVGGGPIAVYEGSTPLIEANHLAGGPNIFGEFGDAAVIRGNTIDHSAARPSIILWEGANAIVEDNTITDAGREGIGVRAGTPTIRANTITDASSDGIHVRQADAAPTIIDNTIEDVGQVGISVASGAPRIEGNTISGAGVFGISVAGFTMVDGHPAVIGNVLRGNVLAITWNGPVGSIDDNDVSGGGEGIYLVAGAPTVTGNRIDGVEGRGLFVGIGASPTLTGNTSCGNGVNLEVAERATPTVDDTNEICEASPAP